MWTKEKLQALQESEFRVEVLIPLFRAMGFLGVMHHHGGPHELGKDIVMWKQDAIKGRVNYAVVAKSKKLRGTASGPGSAGEITTQLRQAFGASARDPVTFEPQAIHECIVACPHDIRTETQHAIASDLGADRRHVSFLCGDELMLVIDQHLGTQSVVPRLGQIGKVLNDASPNYRIAATVRGGEVAISLEPKHPDAHLVEPLDITAVLVFTADAEGQNAQAQFEQHIRTGAPATISNAFIKDLSLPPLIEQLLGKQIAAIAIGPVPARPTIELDFVFHNGKKRHELRACPFSVLQRGRDEGTLRYAHGPYEIDLRLNFLTRAFSLAWRFSIVGANVRAALDAVRLRRLLAQGCTSEVWNTELGTMMASSELAPGGVDDCGSGLETLLEDLEFIQSRTGVPITVSDEELAVGDGYLAHRVARGLRGERHRRALDGFQLPPSHAGVRVFLDSPVGDIGRLAITQTETLTFWGATIELGRVAHFIEGLRLSPDEIARVTALLNDPSIESIDLRFTPGPDGGFVETMYLDYVTPAEKAAVSQQLPA